jgi:hypothetical protein
MPAMRNPTQHPVAGEEAGLISPGVWAAMPEHGRDARGALVAGPSATNAGGRQMRQINAETLP